MQFIGEAFADRRYADDGQLSSRSQEGAVITQPETAAEQIISIVEHGGSSPLTVTGYRWQRKVFASIAIHRVP